MQAAMTTFLALIRLQMLTKKIHATRIMQKPLFRNPA